MAVLSGFLNRIPPSLWTVLLLALGAFVYFRFLSSADYRKALLNELGNFLLLDIIVTRLSVLLLYPSSLLHLSIWTLLSEPPSSGWVVGALAGITYVWFALRRQHLLTRQVLQTWLTALVFGGLLFFAYEWFVSFPPYRNQSLIRFLLDGILAWWLWKKQANPLQLPVRVLGVMGGLLLLTSAVVPQLGKTGPFSSAQWAYVLVIMIAVANEALRDLGRR